MHPSRRPMVRRGRGDPCKEVSNKLNFKIESIHSKNLEAAIQSTP
jgi:hypothetical protein